MILVSDQVPIRFWIFDCFWFGIGTRSMGLDLGLGLDNILQTTFANYLLQDVTARSRPGRAGEIASWSNYELLFIARKK